MNLKTTLILGILLVAGAVGWLVYTQTRPQAPVSATATILREELKPDAITRVEIKRGDRPVLLERNKAGQWTLPGQWPIREPEVQALVRRLGELHSRFYALPVHDGIKLSAYGLEPPALEVVVEGKGGKHTLRFGEEAGEGNRFSRPTYLRVDDLPELLRLAPGLIATFDHPQEYFQQRRLFPADTVAKAEGSAGRVEKLDAKAVTVQGDKGSYTLEKAGDRWQLTNPVKDRVDPDKLEAILTAVPDVWAEKFVDKSDKETGLDNPEMTLIVNNEQGDKLTLLVGNESRKVERVVPGPASPSPFGGPPQMGSTVVEEVYRYARLKDNPQVFEVLADKLKDVFAEPKTLRDEQLARFKTDDVEKVEIQRDKQTLVLTKKDGKWQVEQPGDYPAEAARVTDLLDKLSGLRAGPDDILDDADAKKVGLDDPATVTLTVKDDKKKGETRTIRFALGDKEEKKLHVKVDDWTRVNKVDADVLDLVQRPALAYRDRKLFQFTGSDLASVKVDPAKGDDFTLTKKGFDWQLTAPVQAEADSGKAGDLVRQLEDLEAVEFVTDKASDADLKKYGLDQPAEKVVLGFSDAQKPGKTLLVGKQREGKDDYYARLESEPAVFLVKKDVAEVLARDALAYRPLELWRLGGEPARVKVGKEGTPEYTLKKDKDAWQVTGPFDAPASNDAAEKLVQEVENPKAVRYVAHAAKDLAEYGLDKAYLRVAVTPEAKQDDGGKAEKERVLLVGKAVEKDARERFARLADGEAVFVVGDATLAALDRGPLDLLDKQLLQLDTGKLQTVKFAGKQPFTLENDKGAWKVAGAPGSPFPADSSAVADQLSVFIDLRAERFADYGAKVDLAKYGLAKPETTVTVTAAGQDAKAKPATHTVALGKAVEGKAGERYARLDGGKAVAVLDAQTAELLDRTPLDFVNRSVLSFDPDKVTRVERTAGKEKLELVKKGKGWELLEPSATPADTPTVQSLLLRLADLRAKKVAGYPVTDAKAFGLDQPAAVVRIDLADGDKTKTYRLQIGRPADKDTQDRLARVDDGKTVFVLAGDLAEALLQGALQFRDRGLAKLEGVDRLELVERGGRKVTFAGGDDGWAMTEPVKAGVEKTELEDFVRAVEDLRADKLVALKPGDLKLYGLDQPLLRWKFFRGDKEAATLEVGGTDKSDAAGKDARRYARLAGQDLVVLLSPELSAQVTAEYRDRSVWEAPDAAQVTKVTFDFAKDPFTLEKDGGQWELAGQPGKTLDEAAVTATLDALARLKAQRFTADAGPNLKLYGLEPPQLKVQVQAGGADRVLLVGRQQGGSQFYYATVPGADNPSVFLLPAEEARLILRPAEAYVKK